MGPKELSLARPSGKVRIIGGVWRRRLLVLPDVKDVRPTPDRVRETLFNWLAPIISGARCLDAFAGSGVLGFEAASRGAASVTMLDNSSDVVAHLIYQRELLSDEGSVRGVENGWSARDTGTIVVSHANAALWLGRAADAQFDVIFIDPPYESGLVNLSIRAAVDNGWLAPDGVLYIESGIKMPSPTLPLGWRFEREKRAGRVRYYLASRV